MTKLLFSLLFLAVMGGVKGQYHVAVEANPGNKGEVNIAWLNNYVVTVTNDNWKTKVVIKSRIYYQGSDDNGVRYYTCYYEPPTFQTLKQATVFAHNFTTYKYFLFYENEEYKSYLIISAEYEKQNKKLCFGCKDRKNEKPKPVIIK